MNFQIPIQTALVTTNAFLKEFGSLLDILYCFGICQLSCIKLPLFNLNLNFFNSFFMYNNYTSFLPSNRFQLLQQRIYHRNKLENAKPNIDSNLKGHLRYICSR